MPDINEIMRQAQLAQIEHDKRIPVQLEVDLEEETYSIIRFHFKEESEVIDTGLTLEAAQEHCNRTDSHGLAWFDGYRKE